MKPPRFFNARALCDLLPETPGRAFVLNGLGWGFYTRGQYQEARKLAQRVHDISRRHDDPVLLVCACSLMGVTLCIQGKLGESLQWLRLGLNTCESMGERLNHPAFMIEPGVMLRVNIAVPLMHLGYIDQARQHMADALERAREVRQPMANMIASWCAAMLEMRWRRPQQVAIHAEAVERIAMQAGLAQGAGPRRWLRGYAEAYLESPREGYRRIIEGYRINERLGMYSGCAEVLGYATEALILAQDWPAAEATLQEARALATRLGEDLLHSYFDMLQANMCVARGNEPGARIALDSALNIARNIASPWAEVRALVGSAS
jgi:tetratricopeptide (TPR) repeat protein